MLTAAFWETLLSSFAVFGHFYFVFMALNPHRFCLSRVLQPTSTHTHINIHKHFPLPPFTIPMCCTRGISNCCLQEVFSYFVCEKSVFHRGIWCMWLCCIACDLFSLKYSSVFMQRVKFRHDKITTILVLVKVVFKWKMTRNSIDVNAAGKKKKKLINRFQWWPKQVAKWQLSNQYCIMTVQEPDIFFKKRIKYHQPDSGFCQ